VKELSRRQQAILDFIAGFLDDNDYPPTIRDIQHELSISSTSVVDYNLKVLEDRSLIRRNRNISRGIELVGRVPNRSNLVEIPGSMDMIQLSPELAPGGGQSLFALRVKGHSMVDALINDGDIVVLRHQETCENGETVAVWLRDEKETTLKKFYLEGDRVRLQPANVTMDPIFTSADNIDIQGKLVSVVRAID
jgi:repressor LexA